ncbi:MAG: AEC family transporter [Shimia sp.]
MQALIDVILPVFLLIGAGYGAVRAGWFAQAHVDALMVFTQRFAIPCLLFAAISGLDLAAAFRPALLAAFYAGALSGFVAALAGARWLLGRSWPDAVAIGFSGLFSNSVLLGLPITARAYGTAALDTTFAIVAVHAPFCYGLGIAAMEAVRARAAGGEAGRALPKVLRAMFRNALILGIAAGFAVNLGGLALPGAVNEVVDLLARAALPVALFGLGGVLVRYRPEGDLRAVAIVCAVSLVLHPAVAFGMARTLGLDVDATRSAVLTAAMAPGVNTYIFADMYGAARRVAASGVLVGTALSIGTVWLWLALLP